MDRSSHPFDPAIPLPDDWLSDVVIRTLRPTDLPALEWDGEYIHFRRLYAGAYERQQQGLSVLWVAELPPNGIIGQVFIQLTADRPELADGHTRAYLYSFRVRPAYRSQGLGTAMLAVLEDDLRARGFHSLTLNVAKDNPRARALYERRGFQVVGDEPGIWSYPDHNGKWRRVVEPAWRMEKPLV
jgi:ribosomal protein S18 acetylase RimI-like enzyme